ncbi:hypothetical protein Naga_100612g4 [Nannochloropsis gaditana]|uniref:Uncharacterized protein n=1 Tax=Nannochloropsis gaditana TaxID=72520 RepID=W7TWN2_9STRA|nr:hypothetical protein Naga_100612g4 [Nannochloropsis gaditana]
MGKRKKEKGGCKKRVDMPQSSSEGLKEAAARERRASEGKSVYPSMGGQTTPVASQSDPDVLAIGLSSRGGWGGRKAVPAENESPEPGRVKSGAGGGNKEQSESGALSEGKARGAIRFPWECIRLTGVGRTGKEVMFSYILRTAPKRVQYLRMEKGIGRAKNDGSWTTLGFYWYEEKVIKWSKRNIEEGTGEF